MIPNVLAKVALAVAVAAPLAVLRADDEKPQGDKQTKGKAEAQVQIKVDAQGTAVKVGEEKKEGKKIEVRVLQSEGKKDGKPEVKVLVVDPDQKPGVKQPYLGVAIESVPPALAAQLPGVLSKDQGVLVAEVMAESPAAKAGLKEHDILVSFDDQKLFSAEQLTKLVRGEKPGREVTLSVVRAGKLEKVKATLGEREAPMGLRVLSEDWQGKVPGRIIELRKELEDKAGKLRQELEDKAAEAGKPGGTKVVSQFSSMTLKSLDGDRFRAEIEYKDEKGDTKKWSFEGTRDEIRKQLEADKEMPKAIRDKMLRSLDLGGRPARPGSFRFMMPRWGGGIFIDSDSDEFGPFSFPGMKDFDEIFEQFSNEIDPEIRQKLKGTLRSIEEPRKKPIVRDRTL